MCEKLKLQAKKFKTEKDQLEERLEQVKLQHRQELEAKTVEQLLSHRKPEVDFEGEEEAIGLDDSVVNIQRLIEMQHQQVHLDELRGLDTSFQEFAAANSFVSNQAAGNNFNTMVEPIEDILNTLSEVDSPRLPSYNSVTDASPLKPNKKQIVFKKKQRPSLFP